MGSQVVGPGFLHDCHSNGLAHSPPFFLEGALRIVAFFREFFWWVCHFWDMSFLWCIPIPEQNHIFSKGHFWTFSYPLCFVKKPSNPPPYQKRTRSIPKFSLKRFPKWQFCWCLFFLDDFLWPFHSKANRESWPPKKGWKGHGLNHLAQNVPRSFYLGGGFKKFLFSSLPGEWSNFTIFNIFQMGWNHQLVIYV